MRIKQQALVALALAIFATFFAVGSVWAETLSGALAQTLARNPNLQAARASYEANYKSQFVTLSDMLPKVNAFASQTITDVDAKNAYTAGLSGFATVEQDKYDSDSYGVQVTQELFTSGKNIYAFRSKRAEIRAEEAKLKDTEQQILLGAISAYFDVIRTQSELNLRNKNVAVLTRQLRAVRDRFSVGVVTRTDIAQSEAALAGAQSAKLVAEANYRAARAVYREIVGLEPEALSKPQKLPRLPKSLNRATDIARSESPTLKTAQEQALSGRYTSYSTVGSALPSINVTGTYARTENPNGAAGIDADSSSVVVRLNVPLFSGGRSLAAIAGARDVNNLLKANVHAASNLVEREVIVAWNNVTATQSAIKATEQQIKAAELALEGVRQENELGTRTNLDVLNAEEDLLDARVALVQAERNQYVAAYNLLSKIGRLTANRLRVKPADLSASIR